MKNFKSHILAAVVFFGLASCTNDLVPPEKPQNSAEIALVHAPDVVTWSGEQTFGNTFILTRGSQEAPYWNGEANVKPNDITDEEVAIVVEYFKTHKGKSDAVEVDFSNFFVQQVYYDNGPFTDGNGTSYTGKDCVVEIEVRDKTTGTKLDNIFSGNDNFNKCRYIYDSSSLDFWYSNSKCSYWSNNFKMVYIPGYGYYVGFDVEGQPADFQPDNKNMHITNSPDEWYYDRIIKIVPADEKGNPINPEDSEVPSEEVILHNNEVEVNYAIVDEHKDIADLVTKLSIHVRKGTDVKVVIPMPEKYVVESDDFAIFQKHEEDFGISTGDEKPLIGEEHKSHSLTYTVSGFYPVTLTIAFENSSIIVETNGITQDLIDYLFEINGDGINFEVWNYFDNRKDGEINFTRWDLFTQMDKATIEFLDGGPDYYINAFGWNDDRTDIHPTHAIVTPVSEEYRKSSQTWHLNSTPYNDIYVRQGVIPDHLHSLE